MHPAIKQFMALPAPESTKSFGDASDKARATAQNRLVIVKALLTVSNKISLSYQALRAALDAYQAPDRVAHAIVQLGKMPSQATVYNWCKAYEEGGIDGLLPNHKGREAKTPEWAHECLKIYHNINKPNFEQTAFDLKRIGYKVDAGKVRRFINGLPHELGPDSPYRMSHKLYREKQKDHLIRSTEHIPPGVLYNADGHTLDVYLADLKTGQAARHELTLFHDVGSRKVVGYEISAAESAISTLTALTRSVRQLNHVPALLYIDNGSGYKSAMMNAETVGIYDWLEIEPIFALPGNARVKWVERFFLHMEDWVGKRFESYCGRHHDERTKQRILQEVRSGKRKLPSIADWIVEFELFLEHYHNSPHPEQSGKTRNQVWDEGFVRVEPCVGNWDVLPKAKVLVRRGRVVLHKRQYTAANLHQRNGETLLAGYDLHDDSYINLYNAKGEFLVIAELKEKHHAIPSSRIEQAQINRLEGQRKRKLNQIKELEARAGIEDKSIDLNSVEQFAAVEHQPQDKVSSKEPTIDVNDLLNPVNTQETKFNEDAFL